MQLPAWALSGDAALREAVFNDLDRRFRETTLVRFTYVHTTRALLAENHSDPAGAVELLRASRLCRPPHTMCFSAPFSRPTCAAKPTAECAGAPNPLLNTR